MKCPFCGQEHPNNIKFCPETGNKIELSSLTCRFCGFAGIPADSIFCPNCGAALSAESVNENTVNETSAYTELLDFPTDIECDKKTNERIDSGQNDKCIDTTALDFKLKISSLFENKFDYSDDTISFYDPILPELLKDLDLSWTTRRDDLICCLLNNNFDIKTDDGSMYYIVSPKDNFAAWLVFNDDELVLFSQIKELEILKVLPYVCAKSFYKEGTRLYTKDYKLPKSFKQLLGLDWENSFYDWSLSLERIGFVRSSGGETSISEGDGLYIVSIGYEREFEECTLRIDLEFDNADYKGYIYKPKSKHRLLSMELSLN